MDLEVFVLCCTSQKLLVRHSMPRIHDSLPESSLTQVQCHLRLVLREFKFATTSPVQLVVCI